METTTSGYGASLLKRLFKVRIINFMIVGGLGFLVNMAVYYPLTLFLHAHVTLLGQQFYLPATLIAIPSAISFNYTLNKRYTYRDCSTQPLPFPRYLFMGLATSVLDVILLFIFVQFFHVFYLLAFTLAVLIMFLTRYAISSAWIWKVKKESGVERRGVETRRARKESRTEEE